MKIGVIQASSQKRVNQVLYQSTRKAVKNNADEVINFGIAETEEEEYSYVQTAFLSCLLLESTAVDFIVTGCSSGQGMMLACNSFPGVLCGYTQTPPDAFLFGRINGGNAVSLPLGLNFGWSGELNLQYTLQALFEAPFGVGYPSEDALRKRKDSSLLKEINSSVKRSLPEVFQELAPDFIRSCLKRKCVLSYIQQYGRNSDVVKLLELYFSEMGILV